MLKELPILIDMLLTKTTTLKEVLDYFNISKIGTGGYAVAAIAGIVAVIAIYNKLNVTIEEQREKLEKAKESYNEDGKTEDEIQDWLNSTTPTEAKKC